MIKKIWKKLMTQNSSQYSVNNDILNEEDKRMLIRLFRSNDIESIKLGAELFLQKFSKKQKIFEIKKGDCFQFIPNTYDISEKNNLFDYACTVKILEICGNDLHKCEVRNKYSTVAHTAYLFKEDFINNLRISVYKL